MTDDQAINYLRFFGWLGAADEPDAIADAAVAWQASVGLKPDGELGPKSKSIMRLPRCGCSDVLHNRTSAMRWNKRELTWQIVGYVGDTLSATEQEELTNQMWAAWTKHIDLDIRQARKSEKADIVIGAARGRRANFDGPSGTLAWAELPPGNDQQLHMMFDLDEYWITAGVAQGILYLNVGTHEGGHILGLEHSRKQSALMAPYYSAAVAEPQMNDDVPRIVSLYGDRQGPPPSGGGSKPAKPGGWLGFSIPARQGDLISWSPRRAA